MGEPLPDASMSAAVCLAARSANGEQTLHEAIEYYRNYSRVDALRPGSAHGDDLASMSELTHLEETPHKYVMLQAREAELERLALRAHMQRQSTRGSLDETASPAGASAIRLPAPLSQSGPPPRPTHLRSPSRETSRLNLEESIRVAPQPPQRP